MNRDTDRIDPATGSQAMALNRQAQATGGPVPNALCPEGTIAQLLLRAASTDNGITFVESEKSESTQSYREIVEQAGQRLNAMRAAGLGRGDHVMLIFRDSDDFVISFWAAVLGGIVPVPMAYPTSLSADNAALGKLFGVWQQLEKPLVIADRLLADNAAAVRSMPGAEDLRVIAVDELVSESADTGYTPGSGDDVAFVQYSSGSTGHPKGVMLTHANLLTNIEAMVHGLSLRSDECYLSWMPYHHDMGLIGFHLVPTAVAGRQVNITPLAFVRKPTLWLEKVHQHRANYTGSPNFGLRHLMSRLRDKHLARWDLSCLRLIFNGAEPISVAVMRAFTDSLGACGMPATAVYPVYGMAEACLAVTFPPPDSSPIVHALDRNRIGPGQTIATLDETDAGALLVADEGGPVPGTDIRIVSDSGCVVDENIVGHVQIRGGNVTGGYIRNPQANEAAFDNGWLKTGDLGFMREGRLAITGRQKDIIFVNGQNFYAHDVEAHAETIDGITPGRVAAVGWHDAAAGEERVAVFIAIKSAGDGDKVRETAAQLWRHVNEAMSLPLNVVAVVKSIPKTTSGKTQRFALLDMLHKDKCMQVFDADDLVCDGALPDLPCDPVADACGRITEIWAQVLGRPANAIAADRPFLSLGGTSLKAVQVLGLLEDAFAAEFGHDLLIKCHTVAEMAAFIVDRIARQPQTVHSAPQAPADASIIPARAKPDADDIAIVGLSCRFPGADSPEEYWDNLINGRVSTGEVPRDRWDGAQFANRNGAAGPRWGGFVSAPYAFDATFFGISDTEARSMDPQQRLLLEIVWESLERAGLSGQRSDGHRVGLYIGASHNSYMESITHRLCLDELERFDSVAALDADTRGALLDEWRQRFGAIELAPTTAVNNLLNMIAARTSHALNLRGPSLTVDTACSSSLVAIHLACESLRRGECDIAIGGGVSLALSPTSHLLFDRAGALAPDANARVFDADASGFVLGEGAGAVAMMPLSAALDASVPVLAVIKASAVNNDGRSIGVMAPNPDGQRQVIAQVYRDCGLNPADVQYVEAHGTGTGIGDPSELRALSQAFADAPRQRCAIGSAKANIGHLLSAAGVAGVIKTVLALRAGRLPPNVNLRTPNPQIDFARTPFYTLDTGCDWQRAAGQPRLAAINSFGFGGTNCHLVIAESPLRRRPADSATDNAGLLCLSAKDDDAIGRRAAALADFLRANPDTAFGDVCHTANAGRAHFRVRHCLLATNNDELIAQLDNLTANPAGGRCATAKPALMFTGQGAQYPAMAARLIDCVPAFRQRIEACAAQFDGLLDEPILASIYSPQADPDRLARTDLTQPAMFVIDYAIGRLLLDMGVEPTCMLGHSIGEYAAACLAGVMPLADAAAIVAARGRLMQSLDTGGGMAAAFASREQLEPMLRAFDGQLWFAAHNGAHQVLSGRREALDALLPQLQSAGITARRLRVSQAFHTPLLEPMLDDFRAVLAAVTFSDPTIPLVSNVTGSLVGPGQIDADYWLRHALAPVCFEQSVRCALQTGAELFVECGPDRVLANLTRAIVKDSKAKAIAVLDRRRDDQTCLNKALSELYLGGSRLDWDSYYEGMDASIAPLPTYPFERKIYRNRPAPQRRMDHNATTAGPPVPWIHRWSFEAEAAAPHASLPVGAVVLFADEEVTAELLPRIAMRARESFVVEPGASFEALAGNRYRIDPASAADYRKLLDSIAGRTERIGTLVHLWSLRKDMPLPQAVGDSVLLLGRALANRTPDDQLQLEIVTRGAQIAGSTKSDGRAHQAIGIALGLCVGAELTAVTARAIDLDATAPDAAIAADALFEELATPAQGGDIVAWRAGRRLIRRLDVDSAERPVGEFARYGDTWLITGGATGIGAQTALALASEARVNLVLTGRRVLDAADASDPRLTTINALERLGASVVYEAADVIDDSAMRGVLNRLRERFGRLHGLVHAAGIVDREHIAFADKTPASIERIIAPKRDGAELLDALTRDDPPAHFVLYSSVCATQPGWSSGLADYAAGNAFLDSFAEHRVAAGRPTLAINWSLWNDCGMGCDAGLKTVVRANGLKPLAPESALAVFRYAVATGMTGVMHVLDTDPAANARNVDAAASSGADFDKIDKVVVTAAPQTDSPAPRDVTAADAKDMQSLVVSLVAQFAEIDPNSVDPAQNFQDIGLDSHTAVAMTAALGDRLGEALFPTLLFEYQTPAALAAYLEREYPDAVFSTATSPEIARASASAPTQEPISEPHVAAATSSESVPSGAKQNAPPATPVAEGRALSAGRAPAQPSAQIAVTPGDPADAVVAPEPKSGAAQAASRAGDIAIVGMSCRVPGADNVDEYWSLLTEGRCVIDEVPADRWNTDDFFAPGSDESHKTYSKWGGFVDAPFDFDPQFFGISPREATVMDPQQRLFMEVAFEALQQAGAGNDWRGREVAVFVGCEYNDYGRHFAGYQHYEQLLKRMRGSAWYESLSPGDRDEVAATLEAVLDPAALVADAVAGNGLNQIAARISHWLDLSGPSMMVNTACSSSLVALHMGCEAIRRNESRMAIVGGVHLNLSAMPFVMLSRVTALSPDGVCAPFDKRANGMVLGEGAGALILKPVDAALADGDHIHAVIKGSAINNDGRSAGITAPNPAGQAEAIVSAYRNAGVEIESVSYIECHGTATPLGDPVEVDGMSKAFRALAKGPTTCGIGSVKSSIGHMLSASGVPSVIKVVLAMQNELLPPTVGYQTANPYIDFATTPFHVVAGDVKPWKSDNGPLRAGVNGFGFGGTNCHVVLEQAPAPRSRCTDEQANLLCLTARTAPALRQVADRLLQHMDKHPQQTAAELCLSQNCAQRDMTFKSAAVVRGRQALQAVLQIISADTDSCDIVSGRSNPRQTRALHIVMDGLSDSAATVDALTARFVAIREAVAQCRRAVPADVPAPLARTFELQYGVGRLLHAAGIDPVQIHASDVGLLAASCLTGAISVAQAGALLAGMPSDNVPASAELEPAWSCRIASHAGLPDRTGFSSSSETGLAAVAADELDHASIGADNSLVLHCGAPARVDGDNRIDALAGSDPVTALLDAFARLYAGGVRIDCRALAQDGVCKIPVPTYPFERKTYRCTASVRDAAVSGDAAPNRAAAPVGAAGQAGGAAAVCAAAQVSDAAALRDATAPDNALSVSAANQARDAVPPLPAPAPAKLVRMEATPLPPALRQSSGETLRRELNLVSRS